MEKTNRIVYLDYLRVFATAAVMILHISAQNWHSINVNSFEWQLFNVVDSAVRWCVPVFVMISGSLFLDREVPVKTIYSKHIRHLIMPFVTWSAIYTCFFVGSPSDKLSAFIQGHYHMWFIFMIVGLYMCIPFIKPIAHDNDKSKYFLVIALLFAFIIPETITLANDFGNTTICIVTNALKGDIANMHMHIVIGYTSYFIFGYHLSKISLSRRQRSMIYLFGVVGFVLTVVLDSIIALKTQEPCGHYYGYFTVNVLLEATAIFVWFKHKQYYTEKYYYVIQNLSKYSFGAYLAHSLIIEQLNVRFGLNTMSFNPILAIICLGFIVFMVSFSVSAILNHIPLLRKYMV